MNKDVARRLAEISAMQAKVPQGFELLLVESETCCDITLNQSGAPIYQRTVIFSGIQPQLQLLSVREQLEQKIEGAPNACQRGLFCYDVIFKTYAIHSRSVGQPSIAYVVFAVDRDSAEAKAVQLLTQDGYNRDMFRAFPKITVNHKNQTVKKVA